MKTKRPILITSLSIVAALFGIATVKEGGTVLFTEAGQQGAGNFVPFVLWFNFFAGFVYILAGIMLFKLKSCSRKLSAVIAIATTIVFTLLGVHILNGGAFESRTVVAMTLRSGIWIAIALLAFRAEALKPVDCKC
ncbi:MAG: hypothetical protein J0L82_12545 [Deltaproteobacteria bacterium]|nr:hypothetical protein [Deltaproteobacteria bacterium]